ncbi:MAG: hypothetical protein ABFQ62_01145 [Patescibacteria group bacterium]
MSVKSFSISETVSKAWKLTKANIGFLVGVVLIAWIFPMLITKLLGEGLLSSLLSSAASIIISIGLINISLKIISGKKPKFENLYESYPVFFSYLFASVLVGLMVIVGLIFLIIPGIYLALKYQFAPYLVIDKKMGAIEAIKKSGEMTKGKLMDLFFLALVMLLINILGVLALGVGLLVSTPVSMLSVAYVYKKLNK